MKWEVRISVTTQNQIKRLASLQKAFLGALFTDLRENGPEVNWPRLDKIKGYTKATGYVCYHFKKDEATIVVLRVLSKKPKRMEICYVGSDKIIKDGRLH